MPVEAAAARAFLGKASDFEANEMAHVCRRKRARAVAAATTAAAQMDAWRSAASSSPAVSETESVASLATPEPQQLTKTQSRRKTPSYMQPTQSSLNKRRAAAPSSKR